MVPRNLDEIIDNLLNGHVRGKPCRFNALFSEGKIMELCRHAREVFMEQDMMLKLDVPIIVCGDIHGQFEDLLEIFSKAGTPANESFLFLGIFLWRRLNLSKFKCDYVDRGRQSLECICLLFALKLKYPNELFLLRGNHEDAGMNELYGFYDECKRRYSVKLWKSFVGVFNCMPVAALISGKIFCCHGGLSPSLRSLRQIRLLKRPCPVPNEGLMCDLLWSDPNPEKCSSGWEPNIDRGISFTFGRDVVRQFLNDFGLDLVCRAHEVVQDGYEFFANQGLVTIFSAPLYTRKFDNDGAIMKIDSNLKCQFYIFRPNCQC